jgi:hydroxymethylglutaryl-CoA lyase
MADVVAALDAGAAFIEGSICGIGGGMMTPTTLGTVGNLATEDIVHLLNEMRIATGVTTEAAIAAAWECCAFTRHHTTESRDSGWNARPNHG